MQEAQFIVVVSTLVIFILSFVLALLITRGYLKKKANNYLFWSLGLWTFSICVLFEIAFALGYYSAFLIDTYFFLVVVLVEFLALGSIQLVQNATIRKTYYLYVVIVTLLNLYYTAISNIGNVIQNYVVFGNLPLMVIIASSLGTFAAAVVIVAVAYNSYKKTKSKKMLSIIAGVVVVSIAGTLYIASFPAFLYYSEFFGILLLWAGFVSFPIK